MMMKDIIGVAQTGTGKTASFVLPMIDILAEGRSRALMPRSLILEPTRELAQQVAENFDKYGKNHKLTMALLIGGVVITETVFGIPGLGRLTVDAILRRDYPTIMGVLFFASAMVVVANILTDISYRIADPRLRGK